MSVVTLTVDGKLLSAQTDQSLLQVAREAKIQIPTLCNLDGLSPVGACRLCLVEQAGSSKLLPACTTKVAEGMQIQTATPRLRAYRRMIVELAFSERNHVCSVCVANGSCELQDAAVILGMDHVRYEYLSPSLPVDVTHQLFGIDHNRCILCTRCVRVCDEIEGAHTWDISGRGTQSRTITDMSQPWGESTSCTSCGKCLHACPTGAIFAQGSTVAETRKERERIEFLKTAREKKQWLV